MPCQDGEVLQFPGQRVLWKGWQHMERINLYRLYELGQSLQQIRSRSEIDTPAHLLFFDVMQSLRLIQELLGGSLALGVSRATTVAIGDSLQALLDEFCSETKEDGKIQWRYPAENDPPIPGWRLGMLAYNLAKFETVFSEEMREAATYVVPRRGIYSTPALVNSADDAFPRDVIGHIPQKTREEWCSAGRCLAFNLLSASGFHVVRAVEGTLEAYYQLFCGPPSNSGKPLVWGKYIEGLEKASNPFVPDNRTLEELRQMKDDYRNPLVHPRVVLNECEARMLYNNGESLIIAMAQEIAKATKAAQPALALVKTTGTQP